MAPSESQHTRFAFIDIAKGIGIILVVCSHVHFPLMSWALPCFVPLFFIVSGYCTSHTVNIGDKFLKLLLPYVIFTLMQLIVHWDFRPINLIGAVYSRWCLYPWGVEPNIYFLQAGNAPLWFLTSMFVAFCLYKFIQSSRHPWLFVIAYLVATYLLSFLPVLLPWSIDTAFLMAVFIFMGAVVREKKLLDLLSIFAIVGLTGVYAVLTIYGGNINLSVRDYGTSLLLLFPAAIIGSLLLMKFSILIGHTWVGKMLQRIGILSLPFFGLHVPFVHLWERIFSFLPFSLPPIINYALITVLVIASTYPLALAYEKVFQRLHCGKTTFGT